MPLESRSEQGLNRPWSFSILGACHPPEEGGRTKQWMSGFQPSPFGLIVTHNLPLDTGCAFGPSSDRKPAKRAISCGPWRQPWVAGQEKNLPAPEGRHRGFRHGALLPTGPDVAPDGARSVNLFDATSFPRLSPWATGRRPLRGLALLRQHPRCPATSVGHAQPLGRGPKI